MYARVSSVPLCFLNDFCPGKTTTVQFAECYRFRVGIARSGQEMDIIRKFGMIQIYA
jgi:hypothetical protein